MIATDRDLLVYEPRLFNEAFFASQRVFDSPSAGSLDAAGTTLTATNAKWGDWNVGAGWVVLIADAPAEVVTRFNQTQLYVSKLREDANAAVTSAGSGSSLPVRVSTFRPQIQSVHDALMRGVGIEPTAIVAPGTITEANITNPKALLRAECLGTLQMVYQSVAVAAGEGSVAWAKARSYAERFAEERRRIAVEIDTNADGTADAVRRFSTHWLTRA
jgi:hypothetical protein